ncbi:hypothetical protein TWF694_006063 [Orbilia ellipsospora]|uniref:Zn(2)-C6 fungal-type domain-containing protein n=1 Tax=Orbilia ellipsospora TaxID=2528407 RepID=A0AAV9WSR5_9PEZI
MMRKSELTSSEDETRPVCRRCQRCGFECDGPKDTTFIEGKIVRSRRTEKPVEPSVPGDPGDQNAINRQVVALTAPLKGNQYDMYICYTRKHLRRGGAIDIVLDTTQLSDIIIAGTTPSRGQLFHQTILSFGVILFGLQNRQASIADQGHVLHVGAIKRLNQALSDPKCYYRDEVMLSVATLAILECVVPTGPDNYLKHMIGLERLLELRGTGSSCSQLTFEIYKSVRHMILFASLRTGRPSILARPEWKGLFREHCTEEELAEQDLFDILADCTLLISQRDSLAADLSLDPWDSHPRRDQIFQKALAALAELASWRVTWEANNRNSYFETPIVLDSRSPPIQQPFSDDTSPFLTLFEFGNESAAINLMFYNTTLIVVIQILTSLLREDFTNSPYTQDFSDHVSNESGSPENSLPSLLEDSKAGYIAAERLAALEICRCVPYYASQRSEKDSHSSPLVHWAISTAYTTLSGNESREGKWMMNFVNKTSLAIVAKGIWTRPRSSNS